MVLLAVWHNKYKIPSQVPKASTVVVIDDDFLAEVRKIKSPTTQASIKHHGSNGRYYGYGYREIPKGQSNVSEHENFSSVGPYSVRKNDQASIDQNMDHEKVLASALKDATETIGHLFSRTKGRCVVKSGCIINDTLIWAAHKCNSKLENDLSFVGSSSFPTVLFCVSAETEHFHAECDVSYTLIYVPGQGWFKEGESGRLEMLFALDEDGGLVDAVQLDIGTSLYFSGFFLLHRQNLKVRDEVFFNVAAYGSKPLYYKAKNTIWRNIVDVALDAWIKSPSK
ncbi:hypothetical protein SEMRO_1486_G276690.1 [Seminavis robusta]|uniref:Uncharacterized protein n=1 Tax=Seminavis robusta TaxID=568900 RepID=A0A9N8HT99_9STRA|nr:hypothetical protein SEMRO_1486_G276690.1 [Seminavis robusta]|eukprot:Sro1486_g276690.1 n/a (282) ;mRNA; r:26456-27301